jgi:hypothetical protein
MATSTLISLAEYLSTSYRPDCDFVDGEVRERNVGESEHSILQAAITAWFGTISGNGRSRFGLSSVSRFRRPDFECLTYAW